MKEIARTLKDGSRKILVKASTPRGMDAWHQPKTYVPSLQWHPDTGITRYAFARQHTPAHQIPFFEHLRDLYQSGGASPTPEGVSRRLNEAVSRLPNGMDGIEEEALRELQAEMDKHEIRQISPDGAWRFHITASRAPDGKVFDHLGCSGRDYRTVPDWTLLVRLRSWVLPDEREAYMWLPGQDPAREGFGARYENYRFNNLQFISPREES